MTLAKRSLTGDRVARLPADSGTAARADLDAARLGLGAARDDRRRAASLYLPRVNGFARYDWHARTNPFGGQPSWTLGVMASWSPFSGGAEIAENRTAAARLAGARAGLEAAEAQAGLETARVDADLAVALERQGLAARAVVQSAEAHRLVGRRYASGLATVVELLDAAAVDMQTQLRFSAARYDVLVAVAARLQSRGQSLLPLVSLDR